MKKTLHGARVGGDCKKNKKARAFERERRLKEKILLKGKGKRTSRGPGSGIGILRTVKVSVGEGP
jgi:hypothetical protein